MRTQHFGSNALWFMCLLAEVKNLHHMRKAVNRPPEAKKHPSIIKARLDFSYAQERAKRIVATFFAIKTIDYRKAAKSNWTQCTVEQKVTTKEKKTKIIARNKFDQQYLFKHIITIDVHLISMEANTTMDACTAAA